MRDLVLKIDVDTLRGTLEGVPALVRLLRTHEVGATFLFSLGPDHTGRAIKRVFRKGFLGKVKRTSVLEHYGLKTLLYGTLLPGPDIGLRTREVMRQVAAAGFETGIHTWDHIAWQDGVSRATPQWTHQQLQRAAQRYQDIFEHPAQLHGAAGWQMNDSALHYLHSEGFLWCSDCRGTTPFMPVLADGSKGCPQLPTTLPTLDELLGCDGLEASTVASHLLELTREEAPTGHVFTLHAELEGLRLAHVLEDLLRGWKAQGYRLQGMAQFGARLDPLRLPLGTLVAGTVPGRSGTLMVQGSTP